jgi:threonine dehydrogenase-like Zn-dependent dehydrogenase
VRGISPVCPSCARGDVALCLNVTEGRISAGIQTGFCHDTGGTWADSFVAHVSQLYTVPDNVSDESAVLVEPFACALHGAIRANIQPEETVFIIGCGSIGLLSIAALRALGFGGLIVAAARHPHQGDHARRLGATAVIGAPRGTKRRYKEWAEITGARVRKAELGKPAVLGGADAVFDCVGSSTSIDDAIRFSRPGGRVVLVGMPGVPKGVDWTPMWYQETRVIPTYAYGTETLGNRRMATFALALKMLEDGWDERLKPLADPPVALAEWPRAFDNATHVRENKTVKSVLRIGA